MESLKPWPILGEKTLPLAIKEIIQIRVSDFNASITTKTPLISFESSLGISC